MIYLSLFNWLFALWSISFAPTARLPNTYNRKNH